MSFGGRKTVGWILLVLGVLFLLESVFEGFSVGGFIADLWPVLLILLGIYIIVNRGKFGGRVSDGLKQSKFIGELKTDFAGEEVGNIDLSIFIGELNVDLSGSKFLPGKNSLHVSMGIGETNVRVPADIPVRVSAQIFAGEINYDDHRSAGVFPKLDHADDGYESAERKLHILMDGFVGEMSIKKES